MSLETLNLLNDDLVALIDNSPFSELFTYSSGSFYGIFDNSYINRKEDGGNVEQKIRYPRVIVSSIPDGLSEGVNITRENGDVYKYKTSGKDDEGAELLWLY